MHTDPDYQYKNSQFLRDVWSYIKPYKGRFFFASFCRLVADLANLYPAFAYAGIVTFLSDWHSGDSMRPAWTFLITWAVFMGIQVVGAWSAKHIGYSLAEKAGTDAFSAGISHLVALDTRQHEQEGAGIKLKRVQRGRDAINKIIRSWFTILIEVAVMMLGTFLIVSRIDMMTGIIFAGFIVSYTGLAFSFARKPTSATHYEGIQEEKVQNASFEIISNIRTVRSLGVGSYLLQLLTTDINELYERITKRIFWFRMQGGVLSIWFRYYKIASFAFIIYGISQGRLEIGFLILFNVYFNRITDTAEELSETSQDLMIAKNNLWRLQEMLKFPARAGIIAPSAFPPDWQTLTINKAQFGYSKEQSVLNGVTFSIKRGERIGIVGSSGAGKSTLFKLLLKEYDAFGGSISIDETPIQTIGEQGYFAKVAVVLQDTEVFNLSLRENIITANPAQKDNEKLFNHAVEISHIKDFIHKLPQSYDTVIGEKGFKLSGGERQRLGIARAIFKQPDILLLDEATSHLDIENEEKIRDSLHQVFQHITAVVIAHRLTTIKEMDRILVLENGAIIEEGTFEELYAHKGRFFDLWEKQKL